VFLKVFGGGGEKVGPVGGGETGGGYWWWVGWEWAEVGLKTWETMTSH